MHVFTISQEFLCISQVMTRERKREMYILAFSIDMQVCDKWQASHQCVKDALWAHGLMQSAQKRPHRQKQVSWCWCTWMPVAPHPCIHRQLLLYVRTKTQVSWCKRALKSIKPSMHPNPTNPISRDLPSTQSSRAQGYTRGALKHDDIKMFY